MAGRIHRARLLVLGAAIVVLAGIAGVLASETQARRPSQQRRVAAVLSPRNGQRLAAKPVQVKLIPGSAQVAGATLNGRGIASDLVTGRLSAPCEGAPVNNPGAVCRLEASPSHGLRYGLNVLRLRFKLGRSVLVRTVRFRVAGGRPLAAAGRDRIWDLNTPLRLDGRASLPAPRPQARLRYRWQVIQVPRKPGPQSGLPGARLPSPGWMAGANTAMPRVAFYRTGTYRVRLTVTAPNGQSGRDTVSVDVGGQGGRSGPALISGPPFVRIDTMATVDGKQGVLLHTYRNHPLPGCPQTVVDASGDSCFYPDKGNGRDWVQLVVLHRKDGPSVDGGEGLTLAKPDDNTFIDCPQATDQQEHRFDFSGGGPNPYSQNQQPCIKRLADFVSALDDTDLVIAVNQPGDGTNKQEQPPVGVGAVLSGRLVAPNGSLANGHNLGIGDAGAGWWLTPPNNGETLPDAVRGTFSAVGVPGATKGWISNLPKDPGIWDAAGAGRLQAAISVNNVNDYVLTAPSSSDYVKAPITKVLTQDSEPWPSMTSGQAAALSAVGDYSPASGANAVGLGPDPRAQFYTLDQTDSAWLVTKDHINALTCADLAAQGCGAKSLDTSTFPGVAPFTKVDLRWAQGELSTEIDDLVRVDSYLQTITKPLVDNETTLNTDLDTIIGQINEETVNKATQAAVASALEVIQSVVELIPVAGEFVKGSEAAVKAFKVAAELVATTYTTAMSLAEINGERSNESFTVQGAEFKKKLADRLLATKQEITQSWRNIIVADWGKLRTVASCTLPTSDCGDTWHQNTFAAENDLRELNRAGLRREAYETLVPMKYPWAMEAGLVGEDKKSLTDNAENFCRPAPPYTSETGVILDHTSATGRTIFLPYFLLTSKTISAIGDLPGAVSKSVLEKMFGKEYGNGQLGIDPITFLHNKYTTPGNWIYAASQVRFVGCWAGYSGWTAK